MRHGDKVTYSPYTGGVYFGSDSLAERDLSNPMELIGSRKLADLKIVGTKAFKGSVTEGNEGFYTHISYKKSFTAVSKSHLESKVAARELIATIQSEGMTPKGYMAAMKLEQMKQQSAAIAPVQGIGQDAIDPLRIIEIITRVRGLRPNVYVAEIGFFTHNVNKLDARTPEQDTRNGQVQMRPLEKVDFDKLKYSEGRFSLKKNTFPTLIASETMKRSDFNIQQLNMADAMVGHARMRNGQALQALATLSGAVGGSPTFEINDPEATGTSAIPHGEFNVKKELLAILQGHLDTNESILDGIWVNPIDYARWLSNYDVGGFNNANDDVTVSGVLPMKGIPNVTAYLDRAVPRGLIYAGNSQSLLKGVGPFETEFWKEYTRDANAFLTRDYVQFIIPNPGRYGIKIQIDGTGSDAFVPGTEIVTDADLEAYVQGPQDLLDAPVIS
jgi:hypothetical protein